MTQTIVLFGANGIIGKAIFDYLKNGGNKIISVYRSPGADFCANIEDKESLTALFKNINSFDAVVCAAGNVEIGNIAELTDEQFTYSVSSKLMGQVNIVRTALSYISDNGSITLVSGQLADESIAGGSLVSMINSGINGFVKSAAMEMPRGIRLNCVSPGLISESLKKFGPFPNMQGFNSMAAVEVARMYARSIFGNVNGKILNAFNN